MDTFEMKVIARIRSDFKTKFGIPRQSGLVEELTATVVFEPEFRDPEALRGIEGFSHLWLIWQCSENVREDWAPTVRPPRLGGNVRMGVFATRSPFRPNALGLSCVKLIAVEQDAVSGPVLLVAGADLMDSTPIFDIKPYLPYADCVPEALSGFAPDAGRVLRVEFAAGEKEKLPPEKLDALSAVLANDPRPRYQHDAQRVYFLDFAGYEIKFRVSDDLLQVVEVKKQNNENDRRI